MSIKKYLNYLQNKFNIKKKEQPMPIPILTTVSVNPVKSSCIDLSNQMYTVTNGQKRINRFRWNIDTYPLKFKNRDEYLEWRAIWKFTYKELSATIKQLKADRSSYHKRYSNLLNCKLAFDDDKKILDAAGGFASNAKSNGKWAFNMLEILKRAKKLSYEMKLKAIKEKKKENV